jgi:hypothetical protein
VNFHQFLNGNWTKISPPFLTTSEVPFTIQNKPHGAKIKSLNYKDKKIFNPSIIWTLWDP